MRLCIAGSRKGLTQEQIQTGIDIFMEICKDLVDICECVHGNAPGVDRVGSLYIKNRYHIPITPFNAKYTIHGRVIAPRLRNWEMAHYCDHLLAIWDMRSTGTEHMIACMRQINKPITIFTQEWLINAIEFKRNIH